MRGTAAAAVFEVADSAGTMASSRGKASVTPAPRRKVRRGRHRFVINIDISCRRNSIGASPDPGVRIPEVHQQGYISPIVLVFVLVSSVFHITLTERVPPATGHRPSGC